MTMLQQPRAEDSSELTLNVNSLGEVKTCTHGIKISYLHLVKEGAGIVANGTKFSAFAQRDPHHKCK